ncbi:MAG TPA: hypothetical protein VHA70_07535 [Bauldia sp.]|nr:hypothetical protein [Bauldia sp.]
MGWTEAFRRASLPVLAVAGAAALAGCNSMTYGTGTTPAMQTVQDLTGLATGGKADKAPIDYSPRPKIVAPPAIGALPPPQSDSQTLASTNWPNDPDLLKARVKADADARAAAGQEDQLRLPKGKLVAAPPPGENYVSKEDLAKIKATMDSNKGGMSVDASGAPVRKYLTDPPVEYRLPDPNAPVAVAADGKPKKKFRWWWQKDDATTQ